jgi:hypothetical protein
MMAVASIVTTTAASVVYVLRAGRSSPLRAAGGRGLLLACEARREEVASESERL